MRVHIVPTYRCNLKCTYCYSKDNLKLFKEDMSLDTFKRAVKCLEEKGLSSVSFIGGEPTLWEPLLDAMAYLRERNLKIILYSNGKLSNGTPDYVTLNVTRWKQRKINQEVLGTINFYREAGTQITLRCNISPGDRLEDFREIIMLGKNIGADLSVAVLETRVGDLKYGNEIFDFCMDALDHFKSVNISRPVPFCMFQEEQIVLLKHFCHLHGACNVKALIPLINPDGKVVYPCNSLKYEFSIKDYLEGNPKISQSVLDYHNYTLPKTCLECKYRKSGVCHCGCFVDRLEVN